MQIKIGPLRHFIPAQVRNDELLPMKLVRALDPCRENGMALRCVTPDDQHQIRLRDVSNRTRIAAQADRAEETHGSWRLTIPRAVVYIVSSDHCAGELLHQVRLFAGAFRRGYEGQRIRP